MGSDLSAFIMGMIWEDKAARDSRLDGCERIVVVMRLHRGFGTCRRPTVLKLRWLGFL